MTLRRCENKHIIDKEVPLKLFHTVTMCRCGHKSIIESMPGRYVGDVYNELEEKFHKYEFFYPIQCQACGRMLGSIFSICDDKNDFEDKWDEAKKEGIMPSGFHQN